MPDPDVREEFGPEQSRPWPDVRAPNDALSSATQWGLASVLVGCALLVSACVLLVFNVVLYHGGPGGIPTALALVGGMIGTLTVFVLGVGSLIFGIRGCQQAFAQDTSPALPFAGMGVSLTGLVAWLIASIDLMFILVSFHW